jgi:transcriptional regulator GlxA family with amidase domain
MSTIAIVATSPCYLASLGAMVDAHARLGEVFESNPALGDYSRMETVVRLAGTGPGMIQLAGGRELAPDVALSGLALPRFVYLPSFQLPDTSRFLAMREDLAPFHQWLKDTAQRGILIGACGTSVLHLAAAGLLDRGTCAASPRLVGLLRKLVPRIEIDTDSAIRQEGNLWSCSRDADNPALVARLMAECFSVELGQSLAMREPPGPAARTLSIPVDPIVARAQLWIRDRFTRQFRIADLADELGLSHQTLIRRFAAAGIPSPRHFVQRTRVDAAAAMLVETSRSVTEIAQLVGYADIPSFRRIFRAETGQAPAAFRATRRRARPVRT